MKKYIALILLLLISNSAYANQNGTVLLENCIESIKAMEGNDNHAQLKAAFCSGQVYGVSSMVSVFNAEAEYAKEPKTYFCTPSGVFVNQRIRIIVKYLQDNPDKLHLPDTHLVVYALAEAFPCK